MRATIRTLNTTSTLSNVGGSIVGGAQTHIQALLPALVESGHVVAVLHEDAENVPVPTILDQVSGITTWRIAKKTIGWNWTKLSLGNQTLLTTMA
jgi:hypothetical protein